MNDVKENIRLYDWVTVETQVTAKPTRDSDKEVVKQIFEKMPWKTPVSMGKRGKLSSPVTIDGLRYEPLILTECNIPSAARKRIDEILKSSVYSQEFYIGHEIVNQDNPIKIPWGLIAKIGGVVLALFVAVMAVCAVAAIIVFLVTALFSVLLPLVVLTAFAAGVDPQIVYRTSGGEWLVIFTYLE
jgi:hypothetical protein